MSEAASKKTIPLNATRGQVIYDLYPKLSSQRVREVIIWSIEKVNDTANVPTSPKTHTLSSKHIRLIVEELGTPEGYYPLEGIED